MMEPEERKRSLSATPLTLNVNSTRNFPAQWLVRLEVFCCHGNKETAPPRVCVRARVPIAAVQARESLGGGGACSSAEGCSVAARRNTPEIPARMHVARTHTRSHIDCNTSPYTHTHTHSLKLPASVPHLRSSFTSTSSPPPPLSLRRSVLRRSDSVRSSSPSPRQAELLSLGTCPPTCPLGAQRRPKASPSPPSGSGAACSTRPAQVSWGLRGGAEMGGGRGLNVYPGKEQDLSELS